MMRPTNEDISRLYALSRLVSVEPSTPSRRRNHETILTRLPRHETTLYLPPTSVASCLAGYPQDVRVPDMLGPNTTATKTVVLGGKLD